MGRVQKFNAERWGIWFKVACASEGLGTRGRIFRALASVPDRDDDKLSRYSESRISSWLKGEQGVEARFAFAIGQRLARACHRFDLAGPFALFGAGYIRQAVDMLRRMDVDVAVESHSEMRRQIPPDLAFASSNKSRISDGFSVEWTFEGKVIATNSIQNLDFDASLALVEQIWKDMDSQEKPSFRRGSEMQKRYEAAQGIMKTMDFTTQILGAEKGYKESLLMLDRWVQQFSRTPIHDIGELSRITSMLSRYASAIREIALADWSVICRDYGSGQPWETDPDYPFSYHEDATDIADQVETYAAHFGMMRTLHEEAELIERFVDRINELLDRLRTGVGFDERDELFQRALIFLDMPNMLRGGVSALPRVSELAQNLFDQLDASAHRRAAP